MTDDLPATRREVDLLRDELHRLDDHGSRGVGALQVQLTGLVKDLTEMKADVNTHFDDVDKRFDAHQRVHDQDHRDRVTGRRWLMGIGVAGVASMAGVGGLLFEILSRLH